MSRPMVRLGVIAQVTVFLHRLYFLCHTKNAYIPLSFGNIFARVGEFGL